MGLVSITVKGIYNLTMKATRRANFLGSEGMRKILQDMGKDSILVMRERVGTFTPGPVKDLSEEYKPEKMRKVGYLYPILWRTGFMMSHVGSMVRKNKPGGWKISISFRGWHPDAQVPNATLAAWHDKTRPFIRPPPSFRAKWQRRIREAIRAELSRLGD